MQVVFVTTVYIVLLSYKLLFKYIIISGNLYFLYF